GPKLTLWAPMLIWGSITSLVGSMISRLIPGKRLEGRDKSLDYRIKFYESRFGRFLFRLAGLGAKPAALPAGATQRATELAIGMAADQIFASLAKETKKELKELPLLVRRLEAEAGGMRARVEELNAMIAGVGDVSVAHAESQRERLRGELEAKRDQAS